MVLEHKIMVDVKTKKDVSEELKMEIEKYDKIKKLEKTVEYLLTNVHTYEVTQDRFKKDPELLFAITIPDKNMPLIEKIENNCITLGKICDDNISEGDTTRKEEQCVIGSEDYESLPKDVKPNYKKVVRGGDVKRHIIHWSGDYIKQLREIPCGARLLIKDVAKRLTVAYDDGAYRCLRTVYCAYPKDEKIDVRYLLGLLSSTLLHFYYMSYFYTSQMSPREGNFRFRTQFTERLPISFGNNELQEKIVKQVEKIISLKKELLDLEHKAAHFPNPYLEDGWFFEKLMNKIKAQSLSKSSYKISQRSLKTHYLKDLYGAENFRINLAQDEYIDFGSEEVASYVLEVLRTLSRVTKRELLELKIPQQPHLDNLLNQYRKDKEQIVKNEKAVKELEKQIDDLVYKLYDITHKERRIIEEYLAKF